MDLRKIANPVSLENDTLAFDAQEDVLSRHTVEEGRAQAEDIRFPVVSFFLKCFRRDVAGSAKSLLLWSLITKPQSEAKVG